MATESCEVVRCAGAQHRILWRGNQPTLLDHPDGWPDLDAELVLAALGGAAGCAGRVALWRLVDDVDDIAALAWRTPQDGIGDVRELRAVVGLDDASRWPPTGIAEVA